MSFYFFETATRFISTQNFILKNVTFFDEVRVLIFYH